MEESDQALTRLTLDIQLQDTLLEKTKMSTKMETMSTSVSYLNGSSSTYLNLPPEYETTEAIELSRISPASSSTNSLPEYTNLYNNNITSTSDT